MLIVLRVRGFDGDINYVIDDLLMPPPNCSILFDVMHHNVSSGLNILLCTFSYLNFIGKTNNIINSYQIIIAY
jgi:hypothetical protein